MVPGPPPISSPFLARLGGAAHHARGRCAGGFQLGAVTAVRSPGDGGGAATVVEGGEELREAFNAAVGEDEFLGLDGFRVGLVVVVADVVNAVVVVGLCRWTVVVVAHLVHDRMPLVLAGAGDVFMGPAVAAEVPYIVLQGMERVSHFFIGIHDLYPTTRLEIRSLQRPRLRLAFSDFLKILL